VVNRRDRSAPGGRGAGDGVAIAKHAGESGRGLNVVGSGRMGGALGLRAARCEPFGRGLSGAAREQPATVGVGPARTVGGVLWSPRGTRTANGRGVRPLGSGTRLEPFSADRPHLGLGVRSGSRLAANASASALSTWLERASPLSTREKIRLEPH